MKHHAFYLPSGEIAMVASLQDEVPPELISGLPHVETTSLVSTDTHWWDGEEPVAYSPQGVERKRANPGAGFEWHPATEQWIDLRSLEELKAAKNERINAARLRINESYFVFQGKQIAVDRLSRSDIDGAHGAWLMMQAPPPGWPGGWKAMDNTYVVISDLATWAQFYGAMVATGTANFNHAQALKVQLAAATTAAEVEAIPDW